MRGLRITKPDLYRRRARIINRIVDELDASSGALTLAELADRMAADFGDKPASIKKLIVRYWVRGWLSPGVKLIFHQDVQCPYYTVERSL